MSIMVKRIRLKYGVRCFFSAVVLSAVTIPSAPAQEALRIVAVVNDEVVSDFDVIQRVKMVIATSGLVESPEAVRRITPQVLRTLIDEHLQLQEGQRRNVTADESEINRSIRTIEQNNQMPPGSFLKFLDQRGIGAETLKIRLRSELVWSKLVVRRLRQSVSIDDEDIDNELRRIRENFGKPEYLLSKIFMSVDSPGEDKRVRGDAANLVEQLRDGTDFDAMVEQFSEGVTASRGGGWVSVTQLSPKIVAVIKTMESGQISDPITTGGGYLIIQLRDRRQRQAPDTDDAGVNLKQILLPLAGDSTPEDSDATMALAEVIRETVSDCADMVSTAAELDPSQPADLGIIRIKDTPEPIRTALNNLPLATISLPVRTEKGIHLLMICDKILSHSGLPNRDQIRNTIFMKQLEQVSRQYLQNLRRDAFIDIRQ